MHPNVNCIRFTIPTGRVISRGYNYHNYVLHEILQYGEKNIVFKTISY